MTLCQTACYFTLESQDVCSLITEKFNPNVQKQESFTFFKLLFYDAQQNHAKLCMCNIALLNIYSLDSGGKQLIFFTAQFA